MEIVDTRRQYCTFYLNKLFFGIDVERVQEVLRSRPMTHVPLAQSVVSGLMNLRGQIVTTVDLRRLLALPDRAPGAKVMNVVVRMTDSVASLLVDEIGDVLEPPEETFEPPPETVTGPIRQILRGVCKLEGRLLLVLDIDAVMDTRRWSSDDATQARHTQRMGAPTPS